MPVVDLWKLSCWVLACSVLALQTWAGLNSLSLFISLHFSLFSLSLFFFLLSFVFALSLFGCFCVPLFSGLFLLLAPLLSLCFLFFNQVGVAALVLRMWAAAFGQIGLHLGSCLCECGLWLCVSFFRLCSRSCLFFCP